MFIKIFGLAESSLMFVFLQNDVWFAMSRVPLTNILFTSIFQNLVNLRKLMSS